mmetsp:Transcript_12997/g.30913  ORF Transcript_12997/g.30913 Transcript_12997/m.30913 type:complete len:127 (+) Transcript_12997:92-472(+)|eukprot:1574190-Rhodomonas_salina.2
MGLSSSRHDIAQAKYAHASNDFELAIKSSKELEHILDTEFAASGKGLHEKISSVEQQLPVQLVRDMRRLATIRNKLIHEHGFDAIPDRVKFVSDFERSAQELGRILEEKRKQAGGSGSAGSKCVVM